MTTWLDVWKAVGAEQGASADAIAMDLGADTGDVEMAAKALLAAAILGKVDDHYCRTSEAESQEEVDQLAAAAGIDLAASLRPRGI